MKWINKLFSSRERRRAERQSTPDLQAHYWNGGSPAEHGVRDISTTGLFLLTEERWYPGTLVIMTLQKKDQPESDTDRAIAVQSKAVRWGDDGVGLEFVALDKHDPRRGLSVMAEGADRKTLDRFLEGFRIDNGRVTIKYVVPPTKPSMRASQA
jgi:hypothetical protein